MVAPAVEGIDLFKIAGRSISGWIPSLKTGSTLRQPFCSQLEERLLLWLEYHPLVASYARGDIWIGTVRTLTKFRHYNLVFLHARRKTFPAFGDIAIALQEVWPWGEVASVEEVESRNILDGVGQAPWRITSTQAFIVQRDVL